MLPQAHAKLRVEDLGEEKSREELAAQVASRSRFGAAAVKELKLSYPTSKTTSFPIDPYYGKLSALAATQDFYLQMLQASEMHVRQRSGVRLSR